MFDILEKKVDFGLHAPANHGNKLRQPRYTGQHHAKETMQIRPLAQECA